MSGKTVWMAGGLVLAVGTVAYLSYHETPSGRDAAGTIVAAKRAYVDGTGGSAVGTSTSGTTDDQTGNANGSDRGTDRNGAGHNDVAGHPKWCGQGLRSWRQGL